jgi:hypothetical protein
VLRPIASARVPKQTKQFWLRVDIPLHQALANLGIDVAVDRCGTPKSLSLPTPASGGDDTIPRRTLMQAKLRKTLTGRLLPVVLALAMAQTAVAQPSGSMAQESHSAPEGNTISQLLFDKVRTATRRFLDVNVAMHDGWVPATPCVSGPEAGAMGVHFVLPSRLGDGMLNPNEPEALIYEPMANGALRLVGAEFIVFSSDWASLHPDGGTPAVDGHLTNFVPEPNRFGLHAFYELHVWAWEHNPSGTFADWNTNVSCDNQPGG